MVKKNGRNESITLPYDFYLQLRNWILEVEQELQSLRTTREMTVWEHDPYHNTAVNRSGTTTADPGAFPFRVMFKNSGPHLSDNSEELIVCGRNSSSGHDTESVIYGGPDHLTVFPETSITVTGTGYIYLNVNLDGDSEDYLSATVEFLTSAYMPSALSYPVLLAQIGRSHCGFMTITQIHYGHIHIAGRIV